MREVVIVELQNARDRLEHLNGRVAIAAPLQPQVVVGADAGEHGDLLASQPGHAPHTELGDACLLRRHELAPGAQELAESVR
jgi:hypothetical protein